MGGDSNVVGGNNAHSGGGVVDDDYRRTLLVRQLLDATNVADQTAIIAELSHLATTTTTTATAAATAHTTIPTPTIAVSRSNKTIDTPSHPSPGPGPRQTNLMTTNLQHHRPNAVVSASSPLSSSPSSHPRPTSSSSSSPSGAHMRSRTTYTSHLTPSPHAGIASHPPPSTLSYSLTPSLILPLPPSFYPLSPALSPTLTLSTRRHERKGYPRTCSSPRPSQPQQQQYRYHRHQRQ